MCTDIGSCLGDAILSLTLIGLTEILNFGTKLVSD